jgi:hypothetical protein
MIDNEPFEDSSLNNREAPRLPLERGPGGEVERGELNIPIEHINLVLKRKELAEADPRRMLDWEIAMKQIKSR